MTLQNNKKESIEIQSNKNKNKLNLIIKRSTHIKNF